MWLPTWPTDRALRRLGRSRPEPDTPFALAAAGAGGVRLAAVNAAAAAAGLTPGMTLATVRALHTGLAVRPADPLGDARALAALAGWCRRFTPWVAADGADGLVLDATGCGRLFSGEDGLVDRLLAGLDRFRVAARAGVADTPAAAWALARFGGAGGDRAAVPPGAQGALHALPVAALRLPAATVAALAGLGLETVGDLAALPRAPLVARFGAEVARRLDEVGGALTAPIAAAPEPPRWIVRHGFAQPVEDRAVVEAVLARLVGRLLGELATAGLAARRLVVRLAQARDEAVRITVGGHGPSGDASHFTRLLALRLERLALAGHGVEAMTIEAPDPAPPAADQTTLAMAARPPRPPLAPVLDRLAARLGAGAVTRPAPVASHVPERAQRRVPATAAVRWADAVPAERPARPARLLERPEPVEAVAALPDAPPVLFRWRGQLHRVARADGPERIAPEWWRGGAAGTRDYYRVEDRDGGRFWLYRHGPYGSGGARAAWFLHGLFA